MSSSALARPLAIAITLAPALALALAPERALAQPRSGARPPLPSRGDPYAGYESLLRAVVRDGSVDYRLLRGRIAELRAFCAWLANNGPTRTPAAFGSDAARLAYWLNAYNASVLRAIAESPESMRNVLESQPNSGFFRARTHRVDGRDLTLDAIENSEVRPRARDPRVHVALNCGARSCPALSPTAFRPTTLGTQLDRLATQWVQSGAAHRLDPARATIRASSLFQWFAQDFALDVPGRPAVSVAGPLRFVWCFASAAQREALARACGPDLARCRVEHAPYDWSLNSAR